MKKHLAALLTVLLIITAMPAALAGNVVLSDDASDFVLLSEAVPDAILEIRYYSTFNSEARSVKIPVALWTS